jgi:hypothetical protein
MTFAQKLSIESIMQDPKNSIGSLPSNIFWSEDNKTIYFNWNPDKNKADSLYGLLVSDKKIFKVSPSVRRGLPSAFGVYSKDRSKKVFTRNGDIFLMDTQTQAVRQITNTLEYESDAEFSGKEDKIIFTKANNLFSFNLSNGELVQLSNFIAGAKRPEAKQSEQDKWLKQDQLSMFEILKERADKKKEGEKISKADSPKRPKEFYLDENVSTTSC